MTDEQILYCVIAFVLGWLFARQMGNGFSVGGDFSCMTHYRDNSPSGSPVKLCLEEEGGAFSTREQCNEACESNDPYSCLTKFVDGSRTQYCAKDPWGAFSTKEQCNEACGSSLPQ